MRTTQRKMPGVLKGARALILGATTLLGMSALGARPLWLVGAFALAAAGLALANVELGVLTSLIGITLPVLAINPLVGIALAIAVFAAERYLSRGGASVFLLIVLAVVGAWLGPVWAAAALAGYFLGAGRGAGAAMLAAVVTESVGVLLGHEMLGEFIAGGGGRTALLAASKAPESLLSSVWISEGFKSLSGPGVTATFTALGGVHFAGALVGQVLLWGAAAAVTGLIAARSDMGQALWVRLGAVAAGVGVLAAGDAVTRMGLGIPFSTSTWTTALAESIVVAVGIAALFETVFARVPVQVAAPARTATTMATEDADVDELLRLIATAEDKLASQHTSNKIVLITDMKSFSRMTEEDGSVATAKAIQRHRDLIVPIITANNGCGKSTGGDGIVAAFNTPAEALAAAAAGQKALAVFNETHPNERAVWVRMGLASGEVVLDNGGRPFIGAGLNLAARVMNLADGGQVFATGPVAEGSQEGVRKHSFGMFNLKNIAEPVEVVEILWNEGQQAHNPQQSGTPA